MTILVTIYNGFISTKDLLSSNDNSTLYKDRVLPIITYDS